jgi:hypothetical protein
MAGSGAGAAGALGFAAPPPEQSLCKAHVAAFVPVAVRCARSLLTMASIWRKGRSQNLPFFFHARTDAEHTLGDRQVYGTPRARGEWRRAGVCVASRERGPSRALVLLGPQLVARMACTGVGGGGVFTLGCNGGHNERTWRRGTPPRPRR